MPPLLKGATRSAGGFLLVEDRTSGDTSINPNGNCTNLF
jgi:hypothetical protein